MTPMTEGETRIAPDWWVAGAYPVASDIHRIPMPMPSVGLSAVNTYAIQDGDGLVMIDSGWSPQSDSRSQLEASLGSIGYTLADIRGFLITHLHRDHYTYAIEHRREFGSWVALGRPERDSLEAFRTFTGRPHDVELARLRHAGAAELAASMHIDVVDASIWEDPDRWIESGDEFRIGRHLLTAVSTPGHTRGHVVYVDAGSHLAFTGDHVLPRITPTVGSEAAPTSTPLADFMASLWHMQTFPNCEVLPAHGPVGAELHRRSEELIAHHQRRLSACLAVVDGSPSTPAEVASRLAWTRHDLRISELTPDNQMRAIFETELHLELLAQRSAVATFALAGVAYYKQIDRDK
jgi:glyoxylase-like metal-dependent hydrolase (beta-lactamase superfamily II)